MMACGIDVNKPDIAEMINFGVTLEIKRRKKRKNDAPAEKHV